MANPIERKYDHPLLGPVIVTGLYVPKEPDSTSGKGFDAYIDDMTVVLDGADPRDVTDVLEALPTRHPGSYHKVSAAVAMGIQ